MKLDDPHSPLIPAQSAVLLVFMPPERADRQQWASLVALSDSLQAHLGGLLRVLRIDKVNHPDVVRSFDITHTPAFVLVRQGIELWRQVGMSDEATLIVLIQRRLTA
ncbi:MAG: thioredoxin family protein [Ferruginibacter sp.]|nr:thioredoxin family protein [Cytophagales bacterium]